MVVLGHRVSGLRAGTRWFTRDHRRGMVRRRVRFAFLSDLQFQRYALPLTIHPEVEEALDAGRPVVALESAIITHGTLPCYPYSRLSFLYCVQACHIRSILTLLSLARESLDPLGPFQLLSVFFRV